MINDDINKKIQNIKKNLYQKISSYFRNNNNNLNVSDNISNINIIISNSLFDLEYNYKILYKKIKFSTSQLFIDKRYSFNRIVTVRKDKLLIPLPDHTFLTSDDFKNSIHNYFKILYKNYKNIQITNFYFNFIPDNINNIIFDNDDIIPPNNQNIGPIDIENIDNNPNPNFGNFINNNIFNNHLSNPNNYVHRKMFILHFDTKNDVKLLKNFIIKFSNREDFQIRFDLTDNSYWIFLQFAGRVTLDDPFINSKIIETNSYTRSHYLNFLNKKGIEINPQSI